MNYSMTFCVLLVCKYLIYIAVRIFIHFSCDLHTALADFRRNKNQRFQRGERLALAALCRVPANLPLLRAG
jgi:hypothetical protein